MRCLRSPFYFIFSACFFFFILFISASKSAWAQSCPGDFQGHPCTSNTQCTDWTNASCEWIPSQCLLTDSWGYAERGTAYNCTCNSGTYSCSSYGDFTRCSTRCRPLCTPNCSSKVCGDDGCGGSCGSCPLNFSCQPTAVGGTNCVYNDIPTDTPFLFPTNTPTNPPLPPTDTPIVGIPTPTITPGLINFGVKPIAYTWYQVEHGNVHAENGITDRFPSGFTPAFLSYNPTYASLPSSGIVSVGNSTITIDNGAVSQLGSLALNTSYLTNGATKYDFAYYVNKLAKAGTWPTTACGSGSIAQTDINTHDICYYQGPTTLSVPLKITAGQQKLIFITPSGTGVGPLTISNTISIDPGGFLAIIVSGNITIDPSVGQAPTYPPTTPNLQGFFVTDGTWMVPANATPPDKQLVVKGGVIAWGGFSASRTLGLTNNTIPAYYFIYDPSLLRYMPNALMRSSIDWRQVAP